MHALDVPLHTAHAVLAGLWLGCLAFTTLVVSPALARTEWGESERVLVRARIGRQFLWLANPVLLLLGASLLLDGFAAPLTGARTVRMLVELGLLVLVALLAGGHGFLFGARLRDLATAERRAPAGERGPLAARRHRLQRLSYATSLVDLGLSAAIAALAVNL